MAKKREKAGEYFYYDEFAISKKFPAQARRCLERLLGEHPSPELKARVRLGVESILDPLRAHLGVPVIITSGYRNIELNDAVGGAEHSDHLHACAVDIVVKGMSSYRLALCIAHQQLPYRQLIAYSDKPHVHISWNAPELSGYKHEVVLK